MPTQSLIRTLLWVAFSIAPCSAVWAGDAPAPNPIATRQTLFSIPFTVDRTADPARRPLAVALYVSLDQGATWRFHSRVEPERGTFLFRAAGDGLYWFAIRTIDAQGRAHPEGNPKPGLCVVVDTVPPQLQLEAARGQAGEIIARWQIDDENFDPASLRLYYRVLPQAEWQTVAIEPSHTRKTGGRYHGDVAWLPRNASQRIELRAEIADTAKNLAVSHAQLSGTSPSQDAALAGPPGTSPAAKAAKPFYQSEQEGAGAGNASTQAAVPLPRGATNVPTATPAPPPPTPDSPASRFAGGAGPRLFNPATGDRGPMTVPGAKRPSGDTVVVPNAPNQPAAGPPIGVAAGEGSGANAAGNRGGWRANRGSMPAAPAPVVDPADRPAAVPSAAFLPRPPAPKPADGTVTIAIHPPVGSRFDPSPTNAGNPHAATFPNPAAADARDSRRESAAAQPVPARMVASQRFELEYDVESVGPSGIAQVELWGTRDNGRTWTSFGVDADKQSPFSATVPEEGLYGFRFSVRSGAGLGGEPPAPGSPADIWVGVDLTKPKVRIVSAVQGAGPEADQLTIRWEVEDWALAPRSVSIQFAENREGPWSTVTSGLDQSGQYVWKLDARVPERFHLRVDARDEAGNLGIAETYEPVVIDRRQPQVRIRDVRGR